MKEMKEVDEVKEIQEVNELQYVLYSGCQVCHVVKPEASQWPAAHPLLHPAPSSRVLIKTKRIKLFDTRKNCEAASLTSLPALSCSSSVHKVQS